MSWVYILKSKNGKYYVGSTINIEKRINHHLGGHTPTTKKFGDVTLVFSQKYKNLSEARNIERKIKNLKRKDYIEKIVADGKIKMKP
ncbi:MAG TPA: GIY-YIG nuclease family protein [Candidatus Paceibacterota bacterium]